MLFFPFALTGGPDSSLPTLLKRLMEIPRNDAAWDEFFTRFDERIHRLMAAACVRYSGTYSKEEIGDLVQDLYEHLLRDASRRLRNFKGSTNLDFQHYLATICYRMVSDRLIRNRAKTGRDRPAVDPFEDPLCEDSKLAIPPDQEEALEQREIQDIIKESLQGERARDRRVFVLRHYYGYSAKETADLTGLPAEYIHIIYHRIRKNVEVALAKALNREK